MAAVWADRIRETFTTTGTGAITLLGAVGSYKAASAFFANADTGRYMAIDPTTGAWETGLGHWGTGATWTTDTLEASSTGSKISWATGTKTFVVLPTAAWFKQPDAVADPATALQLTTKQYVDQGGGQRNRIINGAMRIDQRNNGSSSTPTTSAYTLDRWILLVNVASKVTVQQITSTLAGYDKSARITGPGSAYSPSSTEFFNFAQYIEGYHVADLLWGTAAAAPIGIQFRAKASLAGTYSVSIRNAASNRCYIATFVLAASTDTLVSLQIPGDTSGTWAADNTAGMVVGIDLGSGSTFNGTAGAWGSGSLLRTSGSVTLVNNVSATLEISGFQLERLATVASSLTPFERRLHAIEFQLCQRYYQTGGGIGDNYSPSSGVALYRPLQLVPFMRAAPTGSFTASGGGGYSASAVSSAAVDRLVGSVTSNTTGAVNYNFSWTASAEL